MKTKELNNRIFDENDIRANNITANALLFLGLFFILPWILNNFGVFTVPKNTFHWVMAMMLIETIIPYFINRHFKGAKKWLKYLLLFAAALSAANIHLMFTNRVVLVILLPIILSCNYYSTASTLVMSAISILSSVATTIGGCFVGLPDYNFLVLKPEYALPIEGNIASSLTSTISRDMIDYGATLHNTMLHRYLPNILSVVMMILICCFISARTRRLIVTQSEIVSEDVRIHTELDIASDIQTGMLPKILPTFPNRSEFDICASMQAAKEVGGDFYDFFFIDENNFAIVIADVSGKGVPASMFMVISKTLLKNKLQTGVGITEAFMDTNRLICDGNDMHMFVTIWGAVINLQTGHVEYVNAGHNPPLIKTQDEGFSYLKNRPNIALAAIETAKYKKNEFTLQKGDVLYLYTDGVTEAMNQYSELYGEEKLQNLLNANKSKSVDELISIIKSDVSLHAGNEEQSDDITMLALEWKKES